MKKGQQQWTIKYPFTSCYKVSYYFPIIAKQTSLDVLESTNWKHVKKLDLERLNITLWIA
jgi:hypothetical protein